MGSHWVVLATVLVIAANSLIIDKARKLTDFILRRKTCFDILMTEEGPNEMWKRKVSYGKCCILRKGTNGWTFSGIFSGSGLSGTTCLDTLMTRYGPLLYKCSMKCGRERYDMENGAYCLIPLAQPFHDGPKCPRRLPLSGYPQMTYSGRD
ncbi:uncharacterized protein LOC144163614 isoform X2 [Haemaphysalis longicornis]